MRLCWPFVASLQALVRVKFISGMVVTGHAAPEHTCVRTGLIALHKMTKRLHEDHANARALAEGIAKLPWASTSTSYSHTLYSMHQSQKAQKL